MISHLVENEQIEIEKTQQKKKESNKQKTQK